MISFVSAIPDVMPHAAIDRQLGAWIRSGIARVDRVDHVRCSAQGYRCICVAVESPHRKVFLGNIAGLGRSVPACAKRSR